MSKEKNKEIVKAIMRKLNLKKFESEKGNQVTTSIKPITERKKTESQK